MDINISAITVGERFRKEFEGIEELAKSIDKYGLIEPIVLDETNTLIAGERRLKAHVYLKREMIEAKYINELTDLQKKELELEENIQRKDFTWQEEVDAKQKLHALKQEMYGKAVRGYETDSWKLKDTAVSLGESTGTVSSDLQLAKGLSIFPELAKEKSKTTAFKKLKQLQQRMLSEEMSKRLRQAKIISHPEVVNADCVEHMKTMKDESVDLILTDPPYGIDIDNAHTYGRMTMKDTNFKDGEKETMDLLFLCFEQFYRILKNNRHAYLFFAIDKMHIIISMLKEVGFTVHHLPIIWDKGSGSYPSQMTSFVHSYEPILHISKGKRLLNGTPRDVFPIKRTPSGVKIHPTQKPTELLKILIGLSSSPGELVFDPFAGSGSTIVSAKDTQRRAIGVELNPVYYQAICARLEQPYDDVEEVEVDADMDIELEEGELEDDC